MKIALFILCLLAVAIVFAVAILWANRQRIDALNEHFRDDKSRKS